MLVFSDSSSSYSKLYPKCDKNPVTTLVETFWHVIDNDRVIGAFFLIVILLILKAKKSHVKVKVPHSLIAVWAVGVRVPLYLGHN